MYNLYILFIYIALFYVSNRQTSFIRTLSIVYGLCLVHSFRSLSYDRYMPSGEASFPQSAI